MSCHTPVRVRWHCHVRDWLAWRQGQCHRNRELLPLKFNLLPVPHPRSPPHLQLHSLYHWLGPDGLDRYPRRSILRRLSHLRRCKRQHPTVYELPGQQHPWTVEESILQCDARWLRRNWWYCRQSGVPVGLVITSPENETDVAILRSQDLPDYLPGLWACITACLIIIAIVIMLDTYFYFANAKQARGELAIEGSNVSNPYFPVRNELLTFDACRMAFGIRIRPMGTCHDANEIFNHVCSIISNKHQKIKDSVHRGENSAVVVAQPHAYSSRSHSRPFSRQSVPRSVKRCVTELTVTGKRKPGPFLKSIVGCAKYPM